MTVQALQTAVAEFAETHIFPNMANGLRKWILGGTLATKLPRIAEMLAPAGVLTETGEVDNAKLRAFIEGGFKTSPEVYIEEFKITIQASEGQAFLAKYVPA